MKMKLHPTLMCMSLALLFLYVWRGMLMLVLIVLIDDGKEFTCMLVRLH